MQVLVLHWNLANKTEIKKELEITTAIDNKEFASD